MYKLLFCLFICLSSFPKDWFGHILQDKSLSDAELKTKLKKEYRRQSMRLHPDRGGDKAAFQEMRNQYEEVKDNPRLVQRSYNSNARSRSRAGEVTEPNPDVRTWSSPTFTSTTIRVPTTVRRQNPTSPPTTLRYVSPTTMPSRRMKNKVTDIYEETKRLDADKDCLGLILDNFI